MRKLVVFLGLCSVAIGIYFGFIHKPSRGKSGAGVTVLPGIEFVFTRDGNAADCYAKACESLSRRSQGGRKAESLTRQEREWFMQGTDCRKSSWHPEHYPHFTDLNAQLPPFQRMRDLAKLMAEEGRAAEKSGDIEKAMDIWRRVAVFGWHTETEEESFIHVLVGIASETVAYNELVRHYSERGETSKAGRYEDYKQRLRGRSQEIAKFTNLQSASDYARMKSIALSHKRPLWRKEACGTLAYYSITRNPSLRQDVLVTLTKVSQDDPDSPVREAAGNAIPYVLGRKSLPAEVLGPNPGL